MNQTPFMLALISLLLFAVKVRADGAEDPQHDAKAREPQKTPSYNQQQQWNDQQWHANPSRSQQNYHQSQQRTDQQPFGQQQTSDYNQQYENWFRQQQTVLDQQQRLVEHQQAQRNGQRQPDRQNGQQQGRAQPVHSYVQQQVPGNRQNAPPRQRYNPSRNVASQTNEDAFRRSKNEEWEGDNDAEHTKSQENGMVEAMVAWTVKLKRYQVPYVIDKRVNYSPRDLVKIRAHLKEAERKMKVNYKKRDYETYYLVISSQKQCIKDSLKRRQRSFNEIYVCLNAKSNIFNELYRATTIGFQVNAQIVPEESSENSQEVNDNETQEESDSDEEGEESEESVEESEEEDEEHDESY